MEHLVPLIGLIPFVVTWIAYKPYIAFLQAKRVEQFIREEGPASHAGKAKTPTMGGLCFMVCGPLPVLAGYAILTAQSPPAEQPMHLAFLELLFVVVTSAWACGALGLADDMAKLAGRSNKGLSARLRLVVEFVIGLVFSLALSYVVQAPDHSEGIAVSFHHVNALLIGHGGSTGGLWVGLPGLVQTLYTFVIVPFVFMATTNAANLHDGMDGLAAGTAIIVLLALAYMLHLTGQDLSVLALATAASLAAFLCYNKNPAKIFMGDTGSLFIGGMMAALVVAGGLTLWFIPLAVIYIAEAVSVMAQVSYFKLTKPYQPERPMNPLSLALYKLSHRLPGDGKRLLRMAPLHHHFESLAADNGIGEADVVAIFWLCQLFVCAITISLFHWSSGFLSGH